MIGHSLVLFSTVHNFLLSAEIMSNDLTKISELVYQWKITKNQLNEHRRSSFLTKIKENRPSYFNDAPVAYTNCQKHLGMHLA